MKLWTSALVAALVVAGPVSSQVVINEVLPAPGTDWTQNGSFASTEDEWLEIYNAGASPVDVTGWFVSDAAGGAATPRIGLTGTLAPGGFQFLTGELALDWEAVNGFPAVGLSLNNTNETVTLFQVAGGMTTAVDSVSWTGSTTNVLFGPLPDGTGPLTDFDALTASGTGAQPTPGSANGGPATPKILSSTVSPTLPTSADSVVVQVVAADTDGIQAATAFLCVNGGAQELHPMALESGAATYGTWRVALGPFAAGTTLDLYVLIDDGGLLEQTNSVMLTVVQAGASVSLNEILADPASDLSGDANGDGTRDTADDEFVEIYNGAAAAVDLTGWSLHDATGLRHTFASGPVLQAGEYFVVFGGGTPTGIPSGAEIASTGGLSLNNTGDTVQLIAADGALRDAHTYGSEGNGDQSLIRLPDGSGPWTRPGDQGLAAPFSPGAPNGATTAVESGSWAQVKARYR